MLKEFKTDQKRGWLIHSLNILKLIFLARALKTDML
jgi:hypothetical protein